MNPLIQFTTTEDGVRIAYYTMGRGMPFVSTSELQWSHLGTTLGFKEHYRSHSPGGLGPGLQIVRYDARGTGLSDQTAVDFSIDAQLRDLQSVLDAVGLTSFVLFGHAHGSPLAITYAAQFPDRLSHLILSLPHARGHDLRPLAENLGLTTVEEISAEQWPGLARTMALAAFNFSPSPAAEAVAKVYRESMTPASYRAFLEWREAVDVSPLLARIAVPTLVLSRRTKTRARVEVEVAGAIPGTRIVTNDADEQVPGRWLGQETEAVLDFLGIAGVSEAEEASGKVLTARELEVLALLIRGLSNRLIAENLVLSERTVARHIANIYQKTGVHGRAEVTAYALRHRLI
ncbi:MAG TPA: alpha/beta fold hydrolase [Dehalococcoidia bacterium]|nr:alpha/beta fold hydrolase [Dehalococcoidia bacterium]